MARAVVLDVETARILAWGRLNETYEGWTVVSNNEVGHSRWESIHKLVIRDENGDHFTANYGQGLTEYQTVRPFEDESEVTFMQVYPKIETVEVTSYVAA